MLKNDFVRLFTHENITGFVGRRIDRNYLIDVIGDFGQSFYLCGPDEFVVSINRLLLDLGAKADTIVFDRINQADLSLLFKYD
jgi:Na+-transporting NADH:ubiquinone oxidoreductase subunit NqrF